MTVQDWVNKESSKRLSEQTEHSLFQDLMQGLNEAIEVEKGSLPARITDIYLESRVLD